jgi:uridine kinase
MANPIVCIAGGSGSGKSTLVDSFTNAIILHVDSFYKDVSDLAPDADGSYNFDTPDAIDMQACYQAAVDLSEGKDVTIPKYDYVSFKRIGTEIIQAPTNPEQIIVVEGLFALCEPLNKLGILRIFIEAPMEILIARRIKRDIEKQRGVSETLEWFKKVEIGYMKYIEPSKQYANLVIPFSYSPIVFAK